MHGEYKVPGGKLVVVDFVVIDGRMANMQVSGDFFLEPPSALDTIDRALEGLPVESSDQEFATVVRTALGSTPQLFGITPEAVAVAVRRAIDARNRELDAGGFA
ncbi:MAG: biotin--protein ligase [Dokdonella sp.]